MSLRDAESIYSIAEQTEVTRLKIGFGPVADFASASQELTRAVELDTEDDDFWVSIVRRMRQAVRMTLRVPLPLNDPALELAETHDYLSGHLRRAEFAYNDQLNDGLRNACATLAELAALDSNPLGDAVTGLIEEKSGRSIALLLATSAIATRIGTWVATVGQGLEVLSERQLVAALHIDSLLVVGPSQWYSSSVVSAPRAPDITFIQYDWLKDRDPKPGLFNNSSYVPQILVKTVVAESGLSPSAEIFDADELRPTIDWKAISRTGSGMATNVDEPQIVTARLYLLTGGYAAFLEDSDSASETIVDPEADEGDRYRSESTRHIQKGAYVLLRTERSSGDFIELVANRLLGSERDRVRSAQVRWKTALRQKVITRGFDRVDQELRSAGIASPNLVYRLDPRSIRSQSKKDFGRLLTYLELGDGWEDIWKYMGIVQTAHQRAGQSIRRMLQSQILDADMDSLVATGRMDLELEGLGSGSLSILRVEEVSDLAVPVEIGRLGVPLRVEKALWQG
jgi:hypothetical protein